jgi:hypothetical protein
MLAHQFSVSKPPSKPKPSVGKKQLMRNTVEAAMSFTFSHLGEWCLVGTYPVRGGQRKKLVYNHAKYYRDKLETHFAEMLNYHADAYPVMWNIHWNKNKAQYEVRVIADYRPDFAYNEAGEAPVVKQFEADMQEAKRLLDETEADLLAIRDRLVEQKQTNAVKQAMDSLFFGGQS